ncbi:MAG: DUF2339 domain-containing protein [Actinobacteria bacterium]|nr:DUF2339 domain-containing protein [Actinomycetota bacterium]MCA1739706.1 DUF2339 domain-containing protein [Actinomycetota bacterium]
MTRRLRKRWHGAAFLVVGKLFLVDLAEVEAVWRILLFLALSYYLRSLWRPGSGEDRPVARAHRRDVHEP